MAVVIFVCGSVILYNLEKWFLKREGTVYLYYAMIAGFVGCTIYAEIVSVFTGGGLKANIFLCILTISLAILYRKKLLADLKNVFKKTVIENVVNFLIVVCVFGFFLTISGTPIMLFASGDTGFYHS